MLKEMSNFNPMSKKLSIDSVFEDYTSLNIKKYRIQLKLKELINPSEKKGKKDMAQNNTTWDILLYNSKLMALDFFEERKWKKGISHFLCKQASVKQKKLKSNERISDLYKRCLCLHRSILINNNFMDISENRPNILSQPLKRLIKKNSDMKYFYSMFNKWKNTIKNYKAKLVAIFGDNYKDKAKEFVRVIYLMDNLIKIHEERVKLSLKKQMEEESEKEQEVSSATSMDIDSISGKMTNTSNSDLNCEKVSLELNKLIEEFSREFDVKIKEVVSFRDNVNQKDKEFAYGFGYFEMFYDNENLPDNQFELKKILENNIRGSVVLLTDVKNYDFSESTENSSTSKSTISDFDSALFKHFPPLYPISQRPEGSMLNFEIDQFKKKHEKFEKQPNLIEQYNLKFEKFTKLQEVILLWGLCKYGTAFNIVSEIPNIFQLTKSLYYENEEVYKYLDSVLECQYGIDIFSSNFDHLRSTSLFQNDEMHLAIKKFITSEDSHQKFVYETEPALLNSMHCNFIYNKQMKISVFCKNSQNVICTKVPDSEFPICNANKPIRERTLSYFLVPRLFKGNKMLFRTSLNSMYKSLKLICGFKTTRQNQKKIKGDCEKDHNKKDDFLMKALGNTHSFSITQINLNKIKKIGMSNSNEILEGVAFYSAKSLTKEWESLTNNWYQNNTHFKPIFRKTQKNIHDPKVILANQNGKIISPNNNMMFKNISDKNH